MIEVTYNPEKTNLSAIHQAIGPVSVTFSNGPGDAKVGQIDMALARNQEIARLQVAVDNAMGMAGQ